MCMVKMIPYPYDESGSINGMGGCLMFQEQFAIAQDGEEAQRKPPAVKPPGRLKVGLEFRIP